MVPALPVPDSNALEATQKIAELTSLKEKEIMET